MLKRIILILWLLNIFSSQVLASDDITIYDYVRKNGYFYDNPALITLQTNFYMHLNDRFQNTITQSIDNADNDKMHDYLDNHALLYSIIPLNKKAALQINASHYYLYDSTMCTNVFFPNIYSTNSKDYQKVSCCGSLAYNLNKDITVGYSLDYHNAHSDNKDLDNIRQSYWQEDNTVLNNILGIRMNRLAFSVNYKINTITEKYSLNDRVYDEAVDFERQLLGVDLKYFKYNNSWLRFLAEIAYEYRIKISQNLFDLFIPDFDLDSTKDFFKANIVCSKSWQPFMLFAGLTGTYRVLERYYQEYEDLENSWINHYELQTDLNTGVELSFLKYFKFYLIHLFCYTKNDIIKENFTFNNAWSGGLVYQLHNLELELRNKPVVIINDNISDTEKKYRDYQFEVVVRYCY